MKSMRKNQQGLNRTNEKNTNTQKNVKLQKISVEQFDDIKNWSIEDFIILKELGRGKFGAVYAAKQKKSDYVVALKRMSKKELAQNNFQKQVKRQIMIQSALRNDNVLRLFGYFCDENHIYLILEYAPGGQIYKTLKDKGKISERNVSIIIRQVCQGLKYLQQNCIIHRDIKPQNLLISLGNVKIADFGWSVRSLNKRQTLCGTLDYLAPQMVKGSTHDSTIDMWGLGILCYQLAVGKPPFETQTYEETYDKILYDQVRFPQHISIELRLLIRGLLRKQPNKRMKIKQVLQSKFINDTLGFEIIF